MVLLKQVSAMSMILELGRRSCCSLTEFINPLNDKTPVYMSRQGFWNLILTMTYSHMGKPHTTIGDASFHC